jgi:hypothetical protein
MASSRLRLWASLFMAALAVLSCNSSPTAQVRSPGPATSSRLAKVPGSPLPSNDNFLADITCPSPTDCIAVGHVGEGANTVGPDNRTLILQETGGGWKVVPSPNAADEAGSGLNGVTCFSPANCVAVGYSEDGASNSTTLIEQNIGIGWTIVPSPNANAFGGDGSLSGVACGGPTHCVAVGSYESENGNFQTLIEENLGSGWNMVPSPNSGTNEDNALSSVTCAGQSACFAVGSHRAEGHNRPLIEQNAGAGWTLVPSSATGGLYGVACPSIDFCVATGGDLSGGFGPFGGTPLSVASLIEDMTDGTWVVAAGPQVGPYGRVTCPTPTYCISVVRYSTNVLERLSNGWELGSALDNGGKADFFNAVACLDDQRCIAVGYEIDTKSGVRTTFVAQHASQGWTIQASPNG